MARATWTTWLEIVRDPGREELAQRHRAQLRVQAAASEVGVGQPQLLHPGEVLRLSAPNASSSSRDESPPTR